MNKKFLVGIALLTTSCSITSNPPMDDYDPDSKKVINQILSNQEEADCTKDIIATIFDCEALLIQRE